LFVNYKYLEQHSIVTNRVCLARAIRDYGFPQPIALGTNRLAWRLSEVEEWIATRPRRTPKASDRKKAAETVPDAAPQSSP
jgi:Prophage CP4-57 regulatory protein (AlpA)